MSRKLTITIDDQVYAGLHAVIGRGNIANFLEQLARPFVVRSSLADAYAEMASDQQREAEADTWIEGPFRRPAPGAVAQCGGLTFPHTAGGEVHKDRHAVIAFQFWNGHLVLHCHQA